MTPRRLEVLRAAVLDPVDGSRTPERRILVEDDRIVAVLGPGDPAPEAFEAATRVDAAGRVVVPGFIDAHVHLLGYESDLGVPGRESPLYVAARAGDLMGAMLRRGFTTVRDVGGADHGLVRAVEEGYLAGPRIFHGGPALSQTGGHGDFRGAGEVCAHSASTALPTIGLVADGVPAVRAAVRNEIRRGARHIKLMLGGGIASPTDRIDSAQFAEEEIRAAVEEARNAGIYVTGHAYTPAAIARALRLGVRCIEHGTLLDDETAGLFVENDAFLVPTLAIGTLLASEESAEFGVPEESRRKAEGIRAAGTEMLRIARDRGVQVVFGTDFIGPMHRFQSREFAVRAEVLPALDILRSATVTAARLLGEEGELGRIAEGYLADLLVLDVDPLEDIAALAEPERSVATVISRGRVVEG
ncbi:amidohydrolase family protein [Microbacterium sp. 18062]|uniref:metal-dependent hydrolase family protein n=1 Tax=Microbacterium sp. 18062 TaxID=2681410 RepID=UPI00135B04D8|nr:amidohydrolase family protein [Microbacterium sp. 18062]